MIKLLYMCDTHHHRVAPYKTRVGDYHYQIMRKLEEIRKIAKSHGVERILHGGDVFHHPEATHDVLNDCIEAYEAFELPILVDPGNHDMLGDSIASLRNTALGTLERSHVVEIIRDKSEYRLFERDGLQYSISASPYMDNSKADHFMFQKPSGIHQSIHMTHDMIVGEKIHDFMNNTALAEIVDTEADLTINAHNHLGMAPYEYAGKTFLSPGSISRLRMPERIHQPKVIIITITNEKTYYEDVYLNSTVYSDMLFVSTAREQKLPVGVNRVIPTKLNSSQISVEEAMRQSAKELGAEGYADSSIKELKKYKERGWAK